MAHSHNRQINTSNCKLVKKKSLAWYSRGMVDLEIYRNGNNIESGTYAMTVHNARPDLADISADEYLNLDNSPPEFSPSKNEY
jgi:hypothetical protein